MDEITCPACGTGNSEFNLECSGCGDDLSLLSRRDQTSVSSLAAPACEPTSPGDVGVEAVRVFKGGENDTNPTQQDAPIVVGAGHRDGDTAKFEYDSYPAPQQNVFSGSGGRLPRPGDLITDRYEIVEMVGRGGMGVVYKARDTQLDRFVALKLLIESNQPEERHARDLIREAKTVSALNHRNIVTVYNLSTLPGFRFIVMEYLEGQTLHAILKKGETPFHTLLDYALQTTDALEASHLAGIVHSDIKPGNIMVTQKGEVKVLDFGLARYRRGGDASDMLSSRKSTAFAGTFAYMSPEQAQGGKLDPRTDIFSFGILLYEMFLKRHPFQGPHPAAILHNICFIEPSFDGQIHPGILAVLQKTLQKDREKRYQSMNELRWDLAQMLDPTEASRRGFPRPAMARMIAKPKSLLSLPLKLALGAAVVLGCVLAGWFLTPAKPELMADGAVVAAAKEPVVVVLPFRLIGGEPGDQALCDGMLEALTGRLAALKTGDWSPRVIAAGEVTRLQVRTPEDARRHFKAAIAVEGSLQRFGQQLRFIVNLVDADALILKKSETVDGRADDILGLQDQVLATVLHLLELSDVAPRVDEHHGPGEATWQAFLQARGALTAGNDLEDLEAAVAGFEKVLASDPEFASARANLADAYLRLWQIQRDPNLSARAMTHGQKALQEAQHLALAWEVMGRYYAATRQYDQALSHFNKASSLNPTAFDAAVGAAACLGALGRWEEAEAAYKSLLERRPDVYDSLLQLSRFYLRAGRIHDAQVSLAEARRMLPDDIRAYKASAGYYIALGRLEQASAMYRRGLEIKPDAALETGLGRVLLMLGRGGEARAAFRRVIQVYQVDTPAALMDLADALSQGDTQAEEAAQTYAEAVRGLDRVLEKHPHHLAALYRKAVGLAAMGQVTSALEILERRPPGDDPELLLSAAEVYERAGRRAKALQVLAHAFGVGLSPVDVTLRPALHALLNDKTYQDLVSQIKP